MMQFFKPMKGCRIVASSKHPTRKEFDYIGEVIKVDGDIVWFRDQVGDTDTMIWRFKEGNNLYVYFVA